MKRLMRDNTGPRGELDNDAFARALLMFRNTPMQGIGLLPAQIVFGRELRDTMPFKPGKGNMHKEWRVTAEDREKALAKRHVTCLEKLNRHAKELKELEVGQSVKVQNQVGNHGKDRYSGGSTSWYAVRMDGSRNVTLRNRKFLRTFNGVADMMAVATPKPTAWEDNACHSTGKNLPGPGERVREEGADDG